MEFGVENAAVRWPDASIDIARSCERSIMVIGDGSMRIDTTTWREGTMIYAYDALMVWQEDDLTI